MLDVAHRPELVPSGRRAFSSSNGRGRGGVGVVVSNLFNDDTADEQFDK